LSVRPQVFNSSKPVQKHWL